MKKIFEKIINSMLTLAIVFNMFAPMTVLADPPTNYTFTFEVENSELYSVSVAGEVPQGVQVTGTNGNTVIMAKNGNDNAAGTTVSCASTTKCTMTVPIPAGEDKNIKFNYGGGLFDITYGTSLLNFDTNFNADTEFSIKEPAPEPPAGGGAQSPFDGRTVLFWSCGTGTCYHYFNDMPQVNSGEFIFEESIVSDLDNTTKFDVKASTKAFAATNRFEEVVGEIETRLGGLIDWNTFDASQLIGPDGCDYQPVNEPTANNAYYSYADRNFKAIIYNKDYKGVTIGSLDGLTYYPSAWKNELTRTDSVDISGTSKSKPAEIDTVLLESKINIAPVNINGLEIRSIEALDVPANAVTITMNNDGSYKFEFSSRFYNHVVFKITDQNGKEYFLKINRQTIYTKFQHGMGPDNHDFVGLLSDFYYDRTTSYTDYKVTAKIIYKDKTTKIVEMTNAKYIDDGLGNSKDILENDEENPSRDEWPVGKGLKRATMKYDISEEEIKKVDKIYVYVEYVGSTDSSYAGTLAGSGMGELVDLPNIA